MPLDTIHNVKQLTSKQRVVDQILLHAFSSGYDIYGTTADPMFVIQITTVEVRHVL